MLSYPLDYAKIRKSKRKILNEMRQADRGRDLRLAIVGNHTTAELKSYIELFLLDKGYQVQLFEGGFNRYYEDICIDNDDLIAFDPDFVIVNLSRRGLSTPFLDGKETPIELAEQFQDQLNSIVEMTAKNLRANLVLNTIEFDHSRLLGPFESVDIRGHVAYVRELNNRILALDRFDHVVVNDNNYIGAWFGLERWFDDRLWHAFRMGYSSNATIELSNAYANLIHTVLGGSKKVLCLDLDNTLWGGVIGDDGQSGIEIGPENGASSAYKAIQEDARQLKHAGVILTIASKNQEENALLGLRHPNGIVREADFAVIKANWNLKSQSIKEIAHILNVGVDSLVFLDDNPAERMEVSQALPMVSVPEVSNEPTGFMKQIAHGGYFHKYALTHEDQKRADYYTSNAKRDQLLNQVGHRAEYLKQLAMETEIEQYSPLYQARILQLINKTNQFNLNGVRITESELAPYIEGQKGYIGIYGTLIDRFSDAGLVSALYGRKEGSVFYLDQWVMSCRVFKRDLEKGIFSVLVNRLLHEQVIEIHAKYLKTEKNIIMEDTLQSLEFKWDHEQECYTYSIRGPITFPDCLKRITDE